MSEREDFYTAEHIDEQVDALLHAHKRSVQDQRMVHDLRSILVHNNTKDTQEDERSVQRVLHRFLEDEQVTQRQSEKSILSPNMTQLREHEDPIHMKKTHTVSRKVGVVGRAFATLAAVLVVATLISSMLIISHLAHQRQGSSVTGHGTTQPHIHLPQGIYSSSKDSVFRLNVQTHQALWQQSLKDVAKIIPAENVVYVLQSSQSINGINAVLKLDANSGKILWKHTFTTPTQENYVITAQTTDLALAQGRLYVGWQIWMGSSGTRGQIYVLNASDGSQQAVYSNASVWALAVGNGVLAVSGNYSLQVYDLTNGKPLWHLSIQSTTSGPVLSLSIINDRIYAIITSNGEVSGAGQSYIASYKATTGEQVWKSPVFRGDELSHFTVNQNSVYFGTMITNTTNQPFSGHVYAYDTLNNKLLWSMPVDGGAQEPLLVSNGVVYTVADNGSAKHAHMVALNSTTGAIKWQQSLAGTFLDSFTVSNGVVYVGCFSIGSFGTATAQTSLTPEQLEAFNAVNGQRLWEDAQYGTNTVVPTD